MGNSRTLLAALTLLGAAALAGCGSDTSSSPTASTTPTPTSSPSPTAPAAPTAPVMPAAAKEHTKAGAEAFVRYYWEVVNYAQATGDTDSLREISDPGCDFCTAGIEGIESIYGDGGTITGGETTPVALDTRMVASGNTRFALVVAELRVGAITTKRGTTSEAVHSQPRSANDELQLVETLDGWTTVRISSNS